MNNILILITLIFMGCIKPEKELYILPNNFKGTVAVIFNIKDGAPKEYLNDYRVYRIPESGVLFTQFGSNTGESAIDDVQFKIVHGEDTLRIKEHIITKDTTSALSQIFAVETGMFGDKKRYEYISFVVCNYQEWKGDFKKSEELLIDEKRIKDIIDQRLKNVE